MLYLIESYQQKSWSTIMLENSQIQKKQTTETVRDLNDNEQANLLNESGKSVYLDGRGRKESDELKMHETHQSTPVDMTKIDPKWFRKTVSNGEVEYETCIPIDDSEDCEKFEVKMQDLAESLAIAMITMSENLKHREVNCTVCGGLKQEISIDFDEKRYVFTCYRVESLKTKKKLKGTDYRRLSEYLNHIFKKSK
jgi:hypothetical protein